MIFIIISIVMIILSVILLSIPFIKSEGQQPTQQFNKIFLNPFYRASMSQNTNYTYNITINPPDKISSIISAIINFDMWMTPTVTFTLWVNNQSCNNPTYQISTTYAGSGRAVVVFDCSNIITQEGTYQIILKPTQANTGAITGWLDLTYMNNPIGKLEISGTEYSPNDPATIFVQLKDANGLAVSNGSCYLDIYYPLVNGTHNYTLQDAPMLFIGQDDGLYYYDLFAPSILGVYMLSAKCSYTYNYHWLFEAGEVAPTRAVVVGIYEGNSDNLQAVDNNYEKCTSAVSGGARRCEAYYLFNASDVYSQNITNIDIWYAGESSGTPTLTFQVWNFRTTVWDTLPNTLSISTATATTSNPSGVDFFISNTINRNVSDYIANISAGYPYTIWVRTNFASSGNFVVFNNWLNTRTLTAQGTIQDIKGSGEMHITDLSNKTINLISNITVKINNSEIADYIWNYTGTINSNILSQFSQSIWNYFNSTMDFISLIANAVWTRTPDRNLTFYEDKTNYTKIDNTIYAINTSLNNKLDNVNISLSGQIQNIPVDVWNYQDRNLTYYPSQQDLTNYSLIQELIWNATMRTLTEFNFTVDVNQSLIADTVWNAVNRTLTDYNQSDLTDYNKIQSMVWNATDRTLTSFNFTVDVDKQAISNEIWSAVNRTLTYYELPDVSNLTVNINNSAVAEAVWNYNGTISNNILSQFISDIECTLKKWFNVQEGWGVDIPQC